jgi:hypothetical protein
VSANGGKNDVDVHSHSHIVELSKTIDDEVRSNTWASRSSQAKTIFRVSKEKLHAADTSTYQPTFMSIGPYHMDFTEEMRRNEQGKLVCLQSGGAGRSVLEYLEAIESMEPKVRSCYEGDVQMDRYQFCRMLLLDAFQLIVLLEMFGVAVDKAEAVAAAAAGGAADTAAAACKGCSSIGTPRIPSHNRKVHLFLSPVVQSCIEIRADTLIY